MFVKIQTASGPDQNFRSLLSTSGKNRKFTNKWRVDGLLAVTLAMIKGKHVQHNVQNWLVIIIRSQWTFWCICCPWKTKDPKWSKSHWWCESDATKKRKQLWHKQTAWISIEQRCFVQVIRKTEASTAASISHVNFLHDTDHNAVVETEAPKTGEFSSDQHRPLKELKSTYWTSQNKTHRDTFPSNYKPSLNVHTVLARCWVYHCSVRLRQIEPNVA